jgi:hypothetical protein
MNEKLYEIDFAAWSEQQAELLRHGVSAGLDWANLADEIASLGMRDRREIRWRLETILLRLLMWRYDPDRRWRAVIQDHRDRIADLIEESPSLRALPAERLPKAYANARVRALEETGLYHLPEACPWDADQILSPKFLPEP